jgi:hypothetical protein
LLILSSLIGAIKRFSGPLKTNCQPDLRSPLKTNCQPDLRSKRTSLLCFG